MKRFINIHTNGNTVDHAYHYAFQTDMYMLSLIFTQWKYKYNSAE